MNTLLYIANVDWFFLSHRLPIARSAVSEGYRVHLATHFTENPNYLEAEGITLHPVRIARSGCSPLGELRCFLSILQTIRRIKPDLIHLVTIKPVLYGGLAARFLGIRTVAAIPGFGYAFTEGGLLKRFFRCSILKLYRLALGSNNCHAIVQNRTDLATLQEQIGVPLERITLIPGSGVALDDYPFLPEPPGPPVIVMASRLLLDKGVGEFVGAAHLVRKKYPQARFLLVGNTDDGNPSSLSTEDMEAIRQEGIVEVCGFRKDIGALFAKAHIVTLPSYREGLPKVLIEAAACGRVVVTTDAPGCREAILPGETGLLVPVRDSKALSEAILALIEDPNLRKQMGAKGRQLAEDSYSINTVINSHIAIYQAQSRQRIVSPTNCV